ncbi:MAG: hypothetical protein LBD38_00890 [Streptococcaceae bacterium]|jgi:DNA polymerase V|nr:hypothetical protein [Streptococcaceae bacterium]
MTYEVDTRYLKDYYLETYRDRGKMKWQGMYLSEHTATMEREKKERAFIVKEREAQTEKEISDVVYEAFTRYKKVSIQRKWVDKERRQGKDVVGVISSIEENALWLETDDGIAKIPFEEIRNVFI